MHKLSEVLRKKETSSEMRQRAQIKRGNEAESKHPTFSILSALRGEPSQLEGEERRAEESRGEERRASRSSTEAPPAAGSGVRREVAPEETPQRALSCPGSIHAQGPPPPAPPCTPAEERSVTFKLTPCTLKEREREKVEI